MPPRSSLHGRGARAAHHTQWASGNGEAAASQALRNAFAPLCRRLLDALFGHLKLSGVSHICWKPFRGSGHHDGPKPCTFLAFRLRLSMTGLYELCVVIAIDVSYTCTGQRFAQTSATVARRSHTPLPLGRDAASGVPGHRAHTWRSLQESLACFSTRAKCEGRLVWRRVWVTLASPLPYGGSKLTHPISYELEEVLRCAGVFDVTRSLRISPCRQTIATAVFF